MTTARVPIISQRKVRYVIDGRHPLTSIRGVVDTLAEFGCERGRNTVKALVSDARRRGKRSVDVGGFTVTILSGSDADSVPATERQVEAELVQEA